MLLSSTTAAVVSISLVKNVLQSGVIFVVFLADSSQ